MFLLLKKVCVASHPAAFLKCHNLFDEDLYKCMYCGNKLPYVGLVHMATIIHASGEDQLLKHTRLNTNKGHLDQII